MRWQSRPRHCEGLRAPMGAAWRLAQCVLLTIGMNIVLAENEKQAKPVLDRLPAERRAVTRTATVEEAAEILRPYLDAGFGGFTFSNQTLPTHLRSCSPVSSSRRFGGVLSRLEPRGLILTVLQPLEPYLRVRFDAETRRGQARRWQRCLRPPRMKAHIPRHRQPDRVAAVPRLRPSIPSGNRRRGSLPAAATGSCRSYTSGEWASRRRRSATR